MVLLLPTFSLFLCVVLPLPTLLYFCGYEWFYYCRLIIKLCFSWFYYCRLYYKHQFCFCCCFFFGAWFYYCRHYYYIYIYIYMFFFAWFYYCRLYNTNKVCFLYARFYYCRLYYICLCFVLFVFVFLCYLFLRGFTTVDFIIQNNVVSFCFVCCVALLLPTLL